MDSRLPFETTSRQCGGVDDLQPGDAGEIRFVPRDRRQAVEQGRVGEDRVGEVHHFLTPQFDGAGGDAVIERQFRQRADEQFQPGAPRFIQQMPAGMVLTARRLPAFAPAAKPGN